MLDRFLQAQFERGTIVNAVLGNASTLWQLRHALSEGARALGRPVAFRRAALAMLEKEHPHLRVVDFGHIADDGMHFNVILPHDAVPAYVT